MYARALLRNFLCADVQHMCLMSTQDLAKLSLEEILEFLAENRAWKKRLREGTAALVNARLAKAITREEYAASRERANDDSAECKRREEMLLGDLDKREKGRESFDCRPSGLV